MSDIGAMVAELIAAGCAPEVAAAVVARAFVYGVSSTGIPRNSADSVAEKRRAYDRERKRKSTGIPPESTGTTVSHIDTSSKSSSKDSSMPNSGRASRGTRIPADWAPSQAESEFAVGEGLSKSEVTREAARFRDYWKGRAGAGGVKLDWTATWQNWIRTAAEKLGRSPRHASGGADQEIAGFYAPFGSEEQDAWDAYGKQKTGKTFPRDGKGGWRHPTQWPPGYVPLAQAQQDLPAVSLKSM